MTGKAAALDETSLFQPYETAAAVLVAVSGGPDSMALLALAARWGKTPGRPRIEAATVDHGLREGSRSEAEGVARAAAALGVPHHLLTWTGPKPSTRLQERAREARYALLDACAARIGASVLLTAHHADDQAETILFRLTRGSGVAGLAGMARETRRGNLVHGRPLLGVGKAGLVAFCEAEGISFVTDPSNSDPRFARTGLRRLTEVLAAAGLGRDGLLRLGARAARAEAALADCARLRLDFPGAETGEGLYRANISALREAPPEFLVRLLSREIARLRPDGAPPRLDRAEALAARLAAALGTGAGLGASLGGMVARLDKKGVLTLSPEPPRLSRVHRQRSL